MDYFLEQIEKHRHELYRFALRSLWDPGRAEDVFASAVLTAYENKARFTEGTNFRAWMFRIVANKCFVANRETARTPKSLDAGEEMGSWTSLGKEHGYEEVLDDPAAFLDQCGDEVHRAFQRLSTAERSCILLRGVENFSYKDISEILEVPVGTVMTHLSRGRVKLRRTLLEYAREQGIVRPALRLIKPQEEMGNGQRVEGK